eukprot:TRINITY_DN5332_c0_g1_i2.p1 TRINITY_DN5332_c0_g1~~TRINITY_DN5332_c0_g1_i2.p1  ORF type:complete len:280 (+),score=17.31 TRINITY_DN5332_c0_g1_i2:124-963(+)
MEEKKTYVFYQPFGIAFGTVFILQTILSILIWRQRNHPLIKIRCAPLYFINLWMGASLIGFFTCLYYAVFPHMSCLILVWSIFATQNRVKNRAHRKSSLISNKSQQSDGVTVASSDIKLNIVKGNRAWLVSDKFLTKLWGPLAFIHLIFALILTIQYHSVSECQNERAVVIFASVLSILYVVVVLCLVYFLKTAQDAYHLKEEARIVSVVWLVCAVLWTIWQIQGITVIPSYFWSMLGMIICYFVSGFWVYWHIRRDTYLTTPKKFTDISKRNASLINK